MTRVRARKRKQMRIGFRRREMFRIYVVISKPEKRRKQRVVVRRDDVDKTLLFTIASENGLGNSRTITSCGIILP